MRFRVWQVLFCKFSAGNGLKPEAAGPVLKVRGLRAEAERERENTPDVCPSSCELQLLPSSFPPARPSPLEEQVAGATHHTHARDGAPECSRGGRTAHAQVN